MTNVDTIRRYYRAVEAGDRDQMTNLLADSFQWVHEGTNRILGKKEIIDHMMGLRAGVPDLQCTLSEMKHGERVKGTLQFSGTHTAPLSLPPFTTEPVPATDRHITTPSEKCVWIVHGDKLVRQQIKATDGGSPHGLLQQVGIALPAAA